jgi:hypothetical protein
MRFTLLPILALAAITLSAPVSDCESLKSLAILNGGKLFCAERYPAASTTAIAPVDGTPKNHAKRYEEDDQRVMRVLGGMPEQRQKAFCACYPAAASNGTMAA